MKRFLLSCLFLSVYYFTYAQVVANGTQVGRVHFGFKAGINFNNMNFNRGYQFVPSLPVDAAWKPGFNAGFLIEVPVRGKLYIQPEYFFSVINGEDKSISRKYTLNYLSLPVLVRYNMLSKLALIAGPQFDLLIEAKQNEEPSNITHDTEERNIAAVGGIDFSINNRISLNIRYLHGLNNVGIGQRSSVKEFKHEGLQLGAAVRFK